MEREEPHSPKVYGLIGFPLTHSFSSSYFARKFEREGIEAEYVNFEIADIGDIMKIPAAYPGLAGLNVTIPYKEQVLPYLDDIDPEAASIGAVNVIKVVRPGGNAPEDFLFKGYNTDIVGFRESIKPLVGNRGAALVLGTGGASKAVVAALAGLGIGSTRVSRQAREGVVTYADITPELMATHKIIVNTTPLGMYPHTDECPDIPYDMLDPSYLCYDLIYNPEMTRFLQLSHLHGAKVKNGLEMLVLQAEASWRIWNEE